MLYLFRHPHARVIEEYSKKGLETDKRHREEKREKGAKKKWRLFWNLFLLLRVFRHPLQKVYFRKVLETDKKTDEIEREKEIDKKADIKLVLTFIIVKIL